MSSLVGANVSSGASGVGSPLVVITGSLAQADANVVRANTAMSVRSRRVRIK